MPILEHVARQEVSGQRQALVALQQGNNPSTHCRGGWVVGGPKGRTS